MKASNISLNSNLSFLFKSSPGFGKTLAAASFAMEGGRKMTIPTRDEVWAVTYFLFQIIFYSYVIAIFGTFVIKSIIKEWKNK